MSNKKILFITNSFYSHFTPFYVFADELLKKHKVYWLQINGHLEDYISINNTLEKRGIIPIKSSKLAPKWTSHQISDGNISENEKSERNKDFNDTFTPDYNKFKSDVQEISQIIKELKPDYCFTEGSIFAATTATKVTGIKTLTLNIFYMKPRIWDRESIFQGIATHLYARKTLKGVNHYRKEIGLKRISEYSDESDFINIIPSYEFYIDHKKYNLQNTIFTGPLIWDKEIGEENIDQSVIYMIKNKKTIFAYIGTSVKDPSFFQTIIETFKDTDYIILSTVGDKNNLIDESKLPKNIIMKKWFPLSDALKFTKCAIVHGGEKSSMSCLVNNVPTIMTPYFGDQHSHANRFHRLKIGKKILKKDFNRKNILETVNELLSSPIYLQNLNKYSKMALEENRRNNFHRIIEIINK